jgi:hypothetical protein
MIVLHSKKKKKKKRHIDKNQPLLFLRKQRIKNEM